MPIKGAILLFQEPSQPRINGSAWVNNALLNVSEKSACDRISSNHYDKF